MMYNRNSEKEQMNETRERERTNYQYGEYTSRNEYSNDSNNQTDDYDALLYYPQSNATVNRTVPAPKAYEYDEATDDRTPSKTTLQFGSEKGLLKEEIQIQNNNRLREKNHALTEDDPFSTAPYVGYDKQYKINVKAKVLIAVYAIVVVTIFALIVLNTRLLNNMNEDVAMMENQIQNLQTQKQALEEELTHVSSDNEIIRKALEKGFKQVVKEEVQDK